MRSRNICDDSVPFRPPGKRSRRNHQPTEKRKISSHECGRCWLYCCTKVTNKPGYCNYFGTCYSQIALVSVAPAKGGSSKRKFPPLVADGRNTLRSRTRDNGGAGFRSDRANHALGADARCRCAGRRAICFNRKAFHAQLDRGTRLRADSRALHHSSLAAACSFA